MLNITLVSLLLVSSLVLLVVLARLVGSIRRYTYRRSGARLSDAELPTVSVCVPARNEMHAMTACLERLVMSDYPKLEVIVLDDSSVDDTSVLIKSFAHAGVRFVEGQPLEPGWLGKNSALEGLLREASGKYILYMDVDVFLKPDSIRGLVQYTLVKETPLLSIIPQRLDGLRASVFLGTLRYLWLLLFDTKSNPNVNSSAWLVDRQRLLELDGFIGCKSATRPEQVLASSLAVPQGSQLVISTPDLGASYEKKWSSQVETSIRLLKPTLVHSWRSIALATWLVSLILLPLTGIAIALVSSGHFLLLSLCVALILLITCISLVFYRAIWQYGWWLGALHWPYVIAQEATLLLASVYKYATGKVTWKGRSILRQSD